MNGDGILDRAAATLRQHTDGGWIAIRTDVFARALAAFRPSAPVRGHSAAGDFFVAADVVVTHVRDALDALSEAGAARVRCTTGATHDLEAVTVDVVALYGAQLVPLAREVRDAVTAALAGLLGLSAERRLGVPVHVRVSDVTADARLL
ncbi:hypothetical protein [Georgenia sp. AZ-5]|uniref:hypothetical protein n=1 Tax=Georgenia sp. AZ-5 TaxID=3367526 RepID=UPI0037543E51